MISRIVRFVVVGLMLGAVTGMAEQSEKEKIAVATADKWLGIVDEGKYGESWKEAAEYFRNAVKQDQWEQAVQAVRKPLGKLVSRKVKSTSYKTSLPGAPDGQYVVVEFETSFENKKSAIETVTPMMDNDGKWRVSGYYIK
jgi:predicted SnoaL-like aldol condensation-catalyzing enzyme